MAPRSTDRRSIWNGSTGLAMPMGGQYLNSDRWHCWANTQWKRVLKKVGATPARMLSTEDFRSCLAFHAGGMAKTLLAAPGVDESLKQLAGLAGGKPLGAATVRPFVAFTKGKFEWLRKRGRILKAMGYWRERYCSRCFTAADFMALVNPLLMV